MWLYKSFAIFLRTSYHYSGKPGLETFKAGFKANCFKRSLPAGEKKVQTNNSLTHLQNYGKFALHYRRDPGYFLAHRLSRLSKSGREYHSHSAGNCHHCGGAAAYSPRLIA